jgi:hypothetical protein
MKNVLVLIIVSLFFACNRKEDVAKEDSEVQKPYSISKYKMPPPPAYLDYGNNIFIIDKNSEIYYYQRASFGYVCKGGGGGVYDDYNLIPEFIDLKPENIIQIPNDCISDFVKFNLKINVKNIVNVSSQGNSFRSKNAINLIAAIENSCYEPDKDSYNIRSTTQEEDTVLKYKKLNKYYDSDSIKWDKTRIKFPENIKFIKRPTETAN